MGDVSQVENKVLAQPWTEPVRLLRLSFWSFLYDFTVAIFRFCVDNRTELLLAL